MDASYRDEFRQLFDANFGRLEARLGQQIAELRAELRSEMARLETRLIRWMFVFWMGAWVTIAGTVLALQRLH